ncbi:zinc-binding dehydrogenase [Streptomyces nigra]|uniref:zinc-binding dehydrogenase n=1 Tax=Streptomyces nigra TaxID=1827580 RepID=UPI003691E40B
MDHRNEDFAARGRSADVVPDTMGGDTLERSYGTVVQGGFLVTVAGAPGPAKAVAGAPGPAKAVAGAPDPGEAEQPGIRAETFTLDFHGSGSGRIARLVDERALCLLVARMLDLDDVSEAHQSSESGWTRGKIVPRAR